MTAYARVRRCDDTVPHGPHDCLGSIEDWHCPGVEVDECLAESVSKGDPYHPCVCGSMAGHIGRHNCRCGYSWRPETPAAVPRGTTMAHSPVQQHIGECYAQGAPCDCSTAANGPSRLLEEQ